MKRTDRPAMEKQYARQKEESQRRILLSFSEKPSKITLPQYASGDALMEIQRSILELDQVAKANVLDLQEAILGLDRILKASRTSFALLAFGLPLLLFFRVLTLVTHVQSAEGIDSIGELLVLAQRRFLEFKESNVNGEEDEVMWKFGLTLYSLDRLYEVVELHGNQTDEWTSLKEYIFRLAKPGVAMEDKLDALSCLKRTYRFLRLF
ncbi:protein DGS1, mitochondrial [Triticum aestivum]|uniref:protein DGS1, mitochondrial n=1 Tax=Triticum aestivum TaxID=4565 RepID=UPI001D02EF06|nr:protein DGS1, mitochondrial-like [Triticum aestivum]